MYLRHISFVGPLLLAIGTSSWLSSYTLIIFKMTTLPFLKANYRIIYFGNLSELSKSFGACSLEHMKYILEGAFQNKFFWIKQVCSP